MNKMFEVRINPHIPSVSQKIETRFEFEQISYINSVVPDEYSLEYVVNSKIYTYYPDKLLSLLGDIDYEIAEIISKKSHYIEIAGYQILYARIDQDHIMIYEPYNDNTFCDESAAIAQISLSVVLRELWSVRSSVASFVTQRMSDSPVQQTAR